MSAYYDGFESGFEMPDDLWAGFEVLLYAQTLPDHLTAREKSEMVSDFRQGIIDGFSVRHRRKPRGLGRRGHLDLFSCGEK